MSYELNLLPCPWCGNAPDAGNNASFVLTDGVKYGALKCCVTGPEVRTDYKDVDHWKARAIEAWNDRTPIAAVGGAAGEQPTLPPLPPKMGTIYAGNYWTGLPIANPPGAPLADFITMGQAVEFARAAVALNRAQQGEPVDAALEKAARIAES